MLLLIYSACVSYRNQDESSQSNLKVGEEVRGEVEAAKHKEGDLHGSGCVPQHGQALSRWPGSTRTHTPATARPRRHPRSLVRGCQRKASFASQQHTCAWGCGSRECLPAALCTMQRCLPCAHSSPPLRWRCWPAPHPSAQSRLRTFQQSHTSRRHAAPSPAAQRCEPTIAISKSIFMYVHSADHGVRLGLCSRWR